MIAQSCNSKVKSIYFKYVNIVSSIDISVCIHFYGKQIYSTCLVLWIRATIKATFEGSFLWYINQTTTTHHIGEESPTAEAKRKATTSSKSKGKWLKIARKGLLVSAIGRVGKQDLRLFYMHSTFLYWSIHLSAKWKYSS